MKLREFERLVRESRHRLYGYAYYFLGNREEAEDVVQDVYMRLWKNRTIVRADGAAGWLISVTRNVCRDRLRRRRVRSVVEVDSDRVVDVEARQPNPADDAARTDFEQLLAEAIVDLPDPQKTIVILREIMGMSYNEISAALDLPLNTVKVYLHRGRKHLRHRLTPIINSEAV